ncbi:MAG: GntG family PLP-dependent aldolase [Edaphobacter sp.]|uniref:threonine aldolase family protein n=1 Tax=Edaphobacter sp. TaxID=1934404 RepID=UPI0023A2C51E|nr:GntG family PLP-dependent aldolase [Edaphobacter sp.]MDE1175329.1 GntG family PLP-dependent aldolase [Edaphobacter sp.]
MIDLRSDTVTKPTEAMRRAMAEAEVGDDVYGEDPTVNRLEQEAATVFGREAAIFVPTGSMGNQIAIRLHTQHGQEVICESRSHVLDWEMAMMAAFSGCQARMVEGDSGILTWDRISRAFGPKMYFRQTTGLICMENTHNMAGGTVTPLDVMQEVWSGAAKAGLPVHLDGARVFNAATALGIDVATLTEGFDTVMFCLSKGLGAPVGSMLVGSSSAIEKARSIRKALGGGMRQAGILAAAGLISLNEMPKRLAEDHANARLLAKSVADTASAIIDLDRVQTNIVIFTLKDDGDAAAFTAALKARGVLASAIGPHTVRFVTHYDVSRKMCEEAAGIVSQLLAQPVMA